MSTLTIRDCMEPAIVKLSPDMAVINAASLLSKHKIIGAPVLDGSLLIGWVSEIDCMDIVIQVAYYNQRFANVEDIMKTEVLSVKPEDSALDICTVMKGNKPKLYPVINNNNELIGVVSRTNILAALCDTLDIT